VAVVNGWRRRWLLEKASLLHLLLLQTASRMTHSLATLAVSCWAVHARWPQPGGCRHSSCWQVAGRRTLTSSVAQTWVWLRSTCSSSWSSLLANWGPGAPQGGGTEQQGWEGQGRLQEGVKFGEAQLLPATQWAVT
jgi:hypothetical protein